jgi:hypothetical protein
MNQTEKLKAARDLLLKLHKSLVDHERETYEAFNGKTTPTEFLNLLLNDPDLEWLRRFSTLIVDVDEMYAQKDGFTEEQVAAHVSRMKDLVTIEGKTDQFGVKYQLAIQNDSEAAALHAELKTMLFADS